MTPSARDYERAIEKVRGHYPEDVFDPSSASPDAIAARMVRLVCDQIEHGAEAECELRFESRNLSKAMLAHQAAAARDDQEGSR